MTPNGSTNKMTPNGSTSKMTPNGYMKISTTHDLAAAARGRRIDLGWSQAEFAARLKISRKWVYEFEAGKPTSEIGIVLRALQELGFSVELNDPSRKQPRGEHAGRRRNVDLDALLDRFREDERAKDN
jgi:putative transcriptional regulator